MKPIRPEERKLLLESAEWRLLSILFEYPSESWLERLNAVSADVRDAKLLESARLAGQQASQGMYHSIFGPGGPVSPREATYTNGVQLGYLLSELNAFYSAFAYAPLTSEPADHISVEVGFLAYLRLKQAYASVSGALEDSAIAQKAAEDFTAAHLANVAEPMSLALTPVAPPYLVLAGDSLFERVGPRKSPVPDAGAFAEDLDGCAEAAEQLITLSNPS